MIQPNHELGQDPQGAQSERALCSATASWLRASSAVAAWSLGLSLVAIALLALGASSQAMHTVVGLGLVALLGLPERYLALRISLDAGLFKALSDGSIASVHVLDNSLVQLELRKATAVQRTLADRVRGARQLARRHLLLAAFQSFAFLVVLFTLR